MRTFVFSFIFFLLFVFAKVAPIQLVSNVFRLLLSLGRLTGLQSYFHCYLLDMFLVVGRRYQFWTSPFPKPLKKKKNTQEESVASPRTPKPLFFLPSSLQGLNLRLHFATDQFEPVFREALFVSHGMLRRGSCRIVMMSCWMWKIFRHLFELETLDHLYCLCPL